MLIVVLPWVVNCGWGVESLFYDFTPKEVYLLFHPNPRFPTDKGQDLASAVGAQAQVFSIDLVLSPGTAPEGIPAEVVWYPPEGATSFVFSADQPVDPAGLPPFRFSEILIGATLTLSYEFVPVPGEVQVDSAVVTLENGDIYGVSFAHDAAGDAGYFGIPEKAEQEDTWWTVRHEFTTHDGDFTQSDAEELLGFLQSGNIFIGMNYPVLDDAHSSGYRAPVVMRGDAAPSLSLMDFRESVDSREVVNIPLEYAPERHEFLESRLPHHDGRRWIALRPAQTPPVAPPADLPIPLGKWDFLNEVTLELEAGNENCTVEAYVCYEGDEAPPVLGGEAKMAMTLIKLGGKSYRSDGVTCAGPIAIPLADPEGSQAPGFGFMGVPRDEVIPPGTAQLLFAAENSDSTSVSLEFEVDSERGLSWVAYDGDWHEPDLSSPLGDRVDIGADESAQIWLVADVVAGTVAGIETATLTLRATDDPSKSVWQTGTVWIGDWQEPPNTAFDAWVPVAVHAPGANHSQWRTDLGFLNGPGAEAEVAITVHGLEGEHTLSTTVAAGAQVILADLLGQIPYTGGGAVRVESSRPGVATSRTFTELGAAAECFPEGTLGQLLDASTRLVVLGARQTGRIPQLVENSRFRTNIALTNVGVSQARAEVTLHNSSGGEMASYDVTLNPGEWKQENRVFVNHAGVSDLNAGYAEVTVSDGTVIGYGSVVDNTTNDPTTMPLVHGDGATTAWIPVATHAAGANGSQWRTDLGLLNGSGETAEVTITVYGSDGEHTLPIAVAEGEQVILIDLLGQIPYTGGGAVKVEASRPVVATSRTYTELAGSADCFGGGTLGQLLDASSRLVVLGAGQTGWIPQLVENARFRTNIALTNVGASQATAEVTLHDTLGAELVTFSVSLQPGQWKQENQPFASRAGVSDLASGYATVFVTSGTVVGYGSVVDNVTNDPTTLPLVR
jgi:hypothetical protein